MIYKQKKKASPYVLSLIFLLVGIIILSLIEKNIAGNTTSLLKLFKAYKIIFGAIAIVCFAFTILEIQNRKEAKELEKNVTERFKVEREEIYWGYVSDISVMYLTNLGFETYYTKGKWYGLFFKKMDNYKDSYIPLENIEKLTKNDGYLKVVFNRNIMVLHLKDGTKRPLPIDMNVEREAVKEFEEIFQKLKENKLKEEINELL